MNTLSRDIYAQHGLRRVARILQLLDRNPHSATAGCFDRGYWHLRITDYPSGMSEEGALTLALAATLPIADNPWHGQDKLRAWARAALRFARTSAHADGSCDDYYPQERALGAAAFSLHALALSAELVGHDSDDRAFLARRARWLASHDESGQLSNHHAITAAALLITAEVCGAADLRDAAAQKVAALLATQHAEGWFPEYDGCDPGYTTVTVDFLARYWQRQPDAKLLLALERATEFLEHIQHPDGTFGGEYGARNTHHTHTHGFEILAPHLPAARRIADRVLAGLSANAFAVNDDDRLVFHHPPSWLLAWRDFHERSIEPVAVPPGRHWFQGAGLLVDRSGQRTFLAGLKKGGPFRIWKGMDLIANDSGVSLQCADGQTFTSHLAHDANVHVGDREAVCQAQFRPPRRELLTPGRNLLLRGFLYGPGRIMRGFVRRVLQRRVVDAAGASPFQLERRFMLGSEDIVVHDRVLAAPSAPVIREALATVGQTSNYTAAAQPWSSAWLLPETPMRLVSAPPVVAELERRYA